MRKIHKFIGQILDCKVYRNIKYPYFCFDKTIELSEEKYNLIKKLCVEMEKKGYSVKEAKNFIVTINKCIKEINNEK